MAPRLPSQTLASALSFTSSRAPHSPQCRRAFSFVQNQWLEAPSRASLRHGRRCPTNRRYLHATSPLGAPKDPYKTLGVDSKASAADIKKAYFAVGPVLISLARKFHPDTNKDKSAQEKFVEIQEAYDTLKDEKKRAAYDQFGSASQQPGFDPNMYSQGGGFGGFGGFHDFASAFGAQAGARGGGSLFEELFSSFGAGGGGRRPNMRGEDLTSSITISFLESCKGTRRNVSVQPI
ncbi:DnaJ domain-containing protein, partial [Schizophyllum fasciatum]